MCSMRAVISKLRLLDRAALCVGLLWMASESYVFLLHTRRIDAPEVVRLRLAYWCVLTSLGLGLFIGVAKGARPALWILAVIGCIWVSCSIVASLLLRHAYPAISIETAFQLPLASYAIYRLVGSRSKDAPAERP